jgi:two-component system, OmpR family, sensor kinase
MFSFLRRVPLRTKLVATMLTLVIAALVVIGVASTWALRKYMMDQIDNQLVGTVSVINMASLPTGAHPIIQIPTTYIIGTTDVYGNAALGGDSRLTKNDLPPMPKGVQKIQRLIGHPYTVKAINGSRDWRILLTMQPTGHITVIGQQLTDEEHTISRLGLVELIVGGAVLVVVTVVGVALVRASLRPLAQIEETAAAIADGDLTRRVPSFEPEGSARTEVGRLGVALNVMLSQIESSFAAREASEAAAVTAAERANNAAVAAQRSETRARRSEDRMRQFAADASHELRTPLTTIRGFAELYRQGIAATPEQAAGLVRRIEDEAARMGMLVEDLLLLARLDQERPLESLPVDLRVIGADAVVNASVIAPDRRIDLEVEPDSGPLIVTGDELRLRQVVTNLMTNALTYTPAGTRVTVRLGRAAGRPGFAALSVIDRGPGLDAEQIDHIFERFYRADTARTRRTDKDASSGTGLGLAIVAAIVRAHGGTVEVTDSSESPDGRPGGATFRVTLPCASTDETSVPASPEKS